MKNLGRTQRWSSRFTHPADAVRATKKALARRYKPVVSAVRSPMNAKRWLLELSCGHEQWVTKTRAPKSQCCELCVAAADKEADAEWEATMASEKKGTDR